MEQGDILLKKRESDGMFVFLKVLHVEDDYVLIALYDAEHSDKPSSVEDLTTRTLRVVTGDGWKTVPVSYPSLESWDIWFMKNEGVSEE
ncbi:hypothetical protein [Marinobacterium lacunae]|uniref:hypothetical protein n=1 Tax=Marinobacterium lacunae TaxID=1232683 RepID=UPI0005694228|nr:hypothetical protein [Marinobacterium lacunae]